MFKKNPVLWGSLIALLLALNLWKWLPTLKQKGAAPRTAARGLVLEFPLAPTEDEKNVRRDLFASGPPSLSVKAGSHKRIPVKRSVTVVPETPRPSTLATPQAVTIEGYRLMGVVSRNGQNQALLGKGDQLFQVAQGDELEGHYRVDAIGQDEVHLTEKQTGNTLKLRVLEQTGEKH